MKVEVALDIFLYWETAANSTGDTWISLAANSNVINDDGGSRPAGTHLVHKTIPKTTFSHVQNVNSEYVHKA